MLVIIVIVIGLFEVFSFLMGLELIMNYALVKCCMVGIVIGLV